MRSSIRWFAISALAMAAAMSAGPAEGTSGRATDSPAPVPQPVPRSVPRPGAATSRLPLLFVENGGQTDARVALYAKTPGGVAYFTEGGVTWGLVAGGRRWALRLDFVSARESARPEGEDASPTAVSYLKGPRETWHAGLRSWRKVRYRDLWPGIDCVHETKGAGLKYSFELDPGADPADIRIDVSGAPDLRVDDAGRLVATTPVATYVDDRPVAWQDTPDGRRGVAVAFDVRDRRLGFRVGAHDPSLPLVIDPPTSVYAAAFGGAGSDFAGGIATDAAGNAYITGRTTSDETTFPVTAGLDATFNGGDFNGRDDAFVAKINPAGDAFVYVTYLGGTKRDWGTDIQVDATGAAYVCGMTASSADFPTAVGPDLTHGGGLDDGFIVKLNPAGTALVWGGFIGGMTDPFGLDESANGIALDAAGRAHVVGTTAAATGFPTAGGFDATPNGGSDIFVVVVAADGTGFERAGFLGGAGNETGNDIALGPAGSIYVCGRTTAASFPAVVGPDLTYGGGTDDAICAKFDATGALQWAGFWGGASVDVALAIDVDSAGRAYLAGYTGSREDSGFPVVRAFDPTANGGFDGCFARVAADGTAFEVSSFFGGAGGDLATAVLVRAPRTAAKSGSPKSGVPVAEVVFTGTVRGSLLYDSTEGPGPRGGDDLFVAEIEIEDNLSSALLRDVYLFGTAGDDRSEGSAFSAGTPGGSVWTVGDTFSADVSPFTRLNIGDLPAGLLFSRYDFAPNVTPAPLLFAANKATFVTDRRGRRSIDLRMTLDCGSGGVVPSEPLALRVARGWGTASEFTLVSDDPVSTAPIFSTAPGAAIDASVTFALPKSAHGSGRYDVDIGLSGELDDIARPGDVVRIELEQGWSVTAIIHFSNPCPAPAKDPCNPLRIPGAPVEPSVAPIGFAGSINALGDGKLLGKFRLGDVGNVKDAAPDVTIDVGDETSVTLPGDAAKKQGDFWVYKGPGGGGGGAGASATVRLHSTNQTMTIDAKGVKFGVLPEGTNPVDVKVKVGDAEERFRLNIKRMGKKIYW